MEETLQKYIKKRLKTDEKLSKRSKEQDRMWKSQRRQLFERFEKFKLQRNSVLKDDEKKKQMIVKKHRKEEEQMLETQSFMGVEARKRREWTNLRKSD